MTVAYETHCGTKHPANQDSLLSDPSIGLFVVADGMSGHSAGEIASSQAVKIIARHIRAHISEDSDVGELLKQAVLAAHKEVFALSRQKLEWNEMGTTVVLALVRDDRLWIAHVGDSRAYLIADGTITQLTHDHTFVADWLAEGTITPEEAKIHPARHGLYMAVGIDDDIEPDVSVRPWAPEYRVLLCTDGLTDLLEDTELLETVQRAHDGQEACRQLVSKAIAGGEKDDVTVLLVPPEFQER